MKFDRKEQELIRQIEELQLDVHHLNNMVNPILPPALAVEEVPNVLIAEDDGMEVDAESPRLSLRKKLNLLRTTMVMMCPTSTATTPRRSLAIVPS